MVKSLKSEIDGCIGSIVDDEIELYSDSGHEHLSDTDTLVARISQKVTRSQQYGYELLSKLCYLSLSQFFN